MSNPFLVFTVFGCLHSGLNGVSQYSVTQLGHGDFAIREAARDRLRACAGFALPALRMGMSSRDRETAKVAAASTAEIESRVASASLLAPKYMSLAYRNETLESILKDLSKRTGYTIALSTLSPEMLAKPLTIETNGRVPYWEAMRLVGDAIGLAPDVRSIRRAPIASIVSPGVDHYAFGRIGRQRAFFFDEREPPRKPIDRQTHLETFERLATDDFPSTLAIGLRESIRTWRIELANPGFVKLGQYRAETMLANEAQLRRLDSLLPKLDGLAERSRRAKFFAVSTDAKVANGASETLAGVRSEFLAAFDEFREAQLFWKFLRLTNSDAEKPTLHFARADPKLGTADARHGIRVSARTVPADVLAEIRADTAPLLLSAMGPNEWLGLVLESASVESAHDAAGREVPGIRAASGGNPAVRNSRDPLSHSPSPPSDNAEAAIFKIPRSEREPEIVCPSSHRMVFLPFSANGTKVLSSVSGTLAGFAYRGAENLATLDLTKPDAAYGKKGIRLAALPKRVPSGFAFSVTVSFPVDDVYLPVPSSPRDIETLHFRKFAANAFDSRVDVRNESGNRFEVSFRQLVSAFVLPRETHGKKIVESRFTLVCKDGGPGFGEPKSLTIRGVVAKPIRIPFALKNVTLVPGTKPVEKADGK